MPAQDYSAPAWGQSLYQDLTVPTGGRILVKRLDLQDIIAAGLMDEFDTLAPVVEEHVTGPAKGRKPADRPAKKLTKAQKAEKDAADVKAMLADKKQMSNMGRLMGLLIPVVVKKPNVRSNFVQDEAGAWVQLDPADREDGAIYVDSIPMADQMFILEWAMEGMDTSDLKSVREESKSAVGGVDTIPVPTDPPV